MRVNLPITNREISVSTEERLISTTDLKGVIQSANQAFIRVSGFPLNELTGKAHNLVRHPDMPEPVYQNFWDTLKADQPWMGIVKNRCKNGDFYWVNAYVSPVYENGVKTGYQSVRVRAGNAQKARAERLYARVRAGRPVRTLAARFGMRSRAAACAAGGSLVALAGGAALGAQMTLPGLALTVAGLAVAVGGTAFSLRRLSALSQRARAVFDNPVACVTYGDGHDVVAETEVALAMQEARINALRGRVEDLTEELELAAGKSQEASKNGHAALSEQSRELEQAVAAMEQMVATVNEISSNTSAASDSALEASRQATNGKTTILRTTNAMRDLAEQVGESSRAMKALQEETLSIREVLQVIEAIAAQTNLLALNAAIEAARAGDSGRGFAVVATEVRELAAKVSGSTRDIGEMIQRLETRAEQTATIMRKSQETAGVVADDAEASSLVIVEIGQSVDRIRDMTTQIAGAAEEQSAVSADMSRRFNTISDGLRTTREVVSNSRDVGDGLVATVTGLQGVVRQFRAVDNRHAD